MAAELVEHGALHRQDAPVRIVGRVRLRQHVEGLLEIAVVGQRAAPGRKQRLVSGIGDVGLLQHGSGLRALAVGAQRLAIGQRHIGVLGIGAIALAIDLGGALRIGDRARLGLGWSALP